MEWCKEIVGESQDKSKVGTKLLEGSCDIASLVSCIFLCLFLRVREYKECMVELCWIIINRAGFTERGRLRELEFYIEEMEFFTSHWWVVDVAIFQID